MKELYDKYVGKIVSVDLGGLSVKVKIVDVKNSYGKNRFKITPVEGKGEVWTEKIS